jgi:ketosteroid isomerase-like protein
MHSALKARLRKSQHGTMHKPEVTTAPSFVEAAVPAAISTDRTLARNARRSPFIPLVILALSGFPFSARGSEPITQNELVRRTQELFDAVVPGNQEPWQKYYADDCLFADEKGRQMNKGKLIADITPMPAGYSGTIKVVNPVSRIIGDVAILSYDTNETETVFGQRVTASYHATDTWMQRNNNWQIVASQTMRYYEDPAVGRADAARFAQFSGTYELAAGQTRKVFAEGSNLFVERKGKREQLLPETPDLFFRKGVEGRILFRTGADGKVDALIDRRNNEDILWLKKSS